MGNGETHRLTSLFLKATVLCGCGTALLLNMYDCSILNHLQLTSLNLQDRLQRGYLVKILCHLGLKSDLYITEASLNSSCGSLLFSFSTEERLRIVLFHTGSIFASLSTVLMLKGGVWPWQCCPVQPLCECDQRPCCHAALPPHTIRTSHMWTNNHCPHVNCKKRLHGQIPARFWSQRRREFREIGQKRDMVEASLH